MRKITLITVIIAGVLLGTGTMALAQSSYSLQQQPGSVYRGGVSETNSVPPGAASQGGSNPNNYSPLDPRNFPQEDPRQFQPEEMPAAVQGNQSRCIAPDPTWTLLVQYQDECLYAAPLPNVQRWLYSNNVVIPVTEMMRLGVRAGRCGADP
jgi:hypothetical protein